VFKDSIIAKYGLSRICQDIDLISLRNDKIETLIEVKTGKEPNNRWKPYIQKYHPDRSINKLDDINYYSLLKLAQALKIRCYLFRYMKDNLNSGVSIYEISENENSLNIDFKSTRFISQLIGKPNTLSARNQQRKLLSVKDCHNPNLDPENNLYHRLSQEKALRERFYIERDGIWTMLISNEKTFNPLWLYIEINLDVVEGIDLSKLEEEFFPLVEINQKTQLPLSIIMYREDLSSLRIFDYTASGIFKKSGDFSNENLTNFQEAYAKYII